VQLLAVRICTPFERVVKFTAQLFANLHFGLKHRLQLLWDKNALGFKLVNLPHDRLKLIFKLVVGLHVTDDSENFPHDLQFDFDLLHPRL